VSVAAEPVRFDFDDYVHYTETHADGVFELFDGKIFKLAPEGDAHLRTRSAIDWTLNARSTWLTTPRGRRHRSRHRDGLTDRGRTILSLADRGSSTE
jgi:hypothetical protein